jgi:hypothetical protein
MTLLRLWLTHYIKQNCTGRGAPLRTRQALSPKNFSAQIFLVFVPVRGREIPIVKLKFFKHLAGGLRPDPAPALPGEQRVSRRWQHFSQWPRSAGDPFARLPPRRHVECQPFGSPR